MTGHRTSAFTTPLFQNTLASIAVMVAGMVTSVRLVQLRKASPPNFVNVAGNEMSGSAVQFLKA